MRHVILVFTVFMVSNISYSQIYEVGVFGGGSNVIGDVGSTQYINPNSLAFGAIAKLCEDIFGININHNAVKIAFMLRLRVQKF